MAGRAERRARAGERLEDIRRTAVEVLLAGVRARLILDDFNRALAVAVAVAVAVAIAVAVAVAVAAAAFTSGTTGACGGALLVIAAARKRDKQRSQTQAPLQLIQARPSDHL